MRYKNGALCASARDEADRDDDDEDDANEVGEENNDADLISFCHAMSNSLRVN